MVWHTITNVGADGVKYTTETSPVHVHVYMLLYCIVIIYCYLLLFIINTLYVHWFGIQSKYMTLDFRTLNFRSCNSFNLIPYSFK